jgi:hypothetical protein
LVLGSLVSLYLLLKERQPLFTTCRFIDLVLYLADLSS